MPSPKAYGIDEARYMEVAPTMADQALASGSPNNDPRIPDAAVIRARQASPTLIVVPCGVTASTLSPVRGSAARES